MASRQLRGLLKSILHAAIVSPLVLHGCSPKKEATDLAREGYVPAECIGRKLALAGLAPSVIPDVMEMRSRTIWTEGPDAGTTVSFAREGVVCATATDKTSCEAAFDALSPDGGFRWMGRGFSPGYSFEFLATTLGDEVKAWASAEAVLEFLGTIDTGQEAILAAYAQGHGVNCASRVKGLGDSFDVVYESGPALCEGRSMNQVFIQVSSDGGVQQRDSVVLETGKGPCPVDGRRPAGLACDFHSKADDELGRHFADVAHLEAASVYSFLRLRDELRGHGASDALVSKAIAAARDEVAHARETSRLARRFGANVKPPRVAKLPERDLLEIALENEVEGCVRETYSALVAFHKAENAQDPEIRALYQAIAEDETRHAELSWEVRDWVWDRLSAGEQAQVLRARSEAAQLLRAESLAEVDEALIEQAGLPKPRIAAELVARLQNSLWS